MALYRSSTRELALAELPPKLGASVAEHAARHQLELGAVRCWLTRSENPVEEGMMGKLFGRRANSADPDAEHVTAVVLHPTHLLMGTEGRARGVAVLSLPLSQASVTRGHPALETTERRTRCTRRSATFAAARSPAAAPEGAFSATSTSATLLETWAGGPAGGGS